MAIVRGGGVIWDGVSVTANDISDMIYTGAKTALTLFVSNDDNMTSGTFSVLVARGTNSAGLNELPPESEFYTLLKRDGSGPLTFTVAAGTNAAIDLSPLAASYIRLKTSATLTSVTASAESVVGD